LQLYQLSVEHDDNKTVTSAVTNRLQLTVSSNSVTCALGQLVRRCL